MDIHSDLINVVNEIFNQELPKLMDIGQGATEHIHTALVICVSLLEMLWKTNYSLELDFKRIHSIMYSLISHQSFRQHFPPPRLSRKHVVKSHGELVLDGIALTVLGRRDVSSCIYASAQG